MHHRLIRERAVRLDPWSAPEQRDNCEEAGNAGQRAAVFSHRMHHNLPDSDTANRDFVASHV